MRLVVLEGPGELVLNYMWLPVFLSLNTVLLREMEEAIAPLLIGARVTEEVLDQAHNEVLKFLESKFPSIEGLRDYLDALKFVRPA